MNRNELRLTSYLQLMKHFNEFQSVLCLKLFWRLQLMKRCQYKKLSEWACFFLSDVFRIHMKVLCDGICNIMDTFQVRWYGFVAEAALVARCICEKYSVGNYFAILFKLGCYLEHFIQNLLKRLPNALVFFSEEFIFGLLIDRNAKSSQMLPGTNCFSGSDCSDDDDDTDVSGNSASNTGQDAATGAGYYLTLLWCFLSKRGTIRGLFCVVLVYISVWCQNCLQLIFSYHIFVESIYMASKKFSLVESCLMCNPE